VIVRGIAGDVVAIIGGQRRDAEFAAYLHQSLADTAFDRQSVVHQFEEVVLSTEDLPPRGG
jgi:hypothetical protein